MAKRNSARQVGQKANHKGGAGSYTVSAGASSAEFNAIVTLYSQGRFAEAESAARKVTERFPDHGLGWKCLGVIQKAAGSVEQSLPALEKAARLLPDDAEAQSNLGVVYKELHRLTEAEACYRRALAIKPDLLEALNNLGVVLKERGEWQQSESFYRRALLLAPHHADLHSNLGALFKEMGRLEEAEQSQRRALALKPGFAKGYFNLANVLAEMGRLTDAETGYLKALAINGEYAEAHCNLGVLLKDLGRMSEAEQCCRRAVQLRPDFNEARSVLLFLLNYAPGIAPATLLDEALQYGRMVAVQVQQRFTTWHCHAAPERLRVGFVSADLHSHPVGYFLESLLTNLDSSRVELYAYSNSPLCDELTERLKPRFTCWQLLCGMADADAAQLIHGDGIHLLVDLSGHTSGNRLPLFAWKPAPVQLSWLGYFATTGVAEIDYLLADATGVPEVQDNNFTETVYRLPDTRLCFTPPQSHAEVALLPALAAGHITFGCFQNLAKITDPVLSVWSTILEAVPNARLRLQCKQLGDKKTADEFTRRLAGHGILQERFSLHGSDTYDAYLASYAAVDIALDTFPYPGGTTTCEALWMGVPTVTVAGESLVARQGVCLLTAAGLPEWCADSETGYVQLAVAHARAVQKLAELRSTLRPRLLASPLFNAVTFARTMETAWWDMWQTTSGQRGISLSE